MSANCYYEESGRPVGPVTPETLRELARQGVIRPGTSVWATGAPAWQAFAEWEAAQNADAPSAPPPAAAASPLDEAPSELRLAAPRMAASPVPEPAAPTLDAASKVPSAFATGLADCRKCGKSWARTYLNEQRADGPVCRACEAKERQESTIAASGDQNVSVRVKSDNRLYYALFFLWLGAIAVWFGPRFFLRAKRSGFLEERRGVAERPDWGQRAPSKWPALVLVNDARFRDGAELPPSIALLVERRSDGQIFGVTAGTYFGGRPPQRKDQIDLRRFAGTLTPAALPNVTPASLGETTQSWRAAVPGQPGQAVEFTRPRGRAVEYERLGIQVFETTLEPRSTAPVTPLPAIRSASPTPRLLVIRPAADGGKGQEALASALTSTGSFGIKIRLLEPTRAAGLCGAPVLNAFGQLVGVVYGSEQTPDAQGRVTEVLVESIDNFAELIGE